MKRVTVILLIVIAVGVLWIAFKVTETSKITYDRSAALIYNYEGMKEAQQKQDKKEMKLKYNLDSLQVNFQKAVNLYNQDYPKLSKEEKFKREKLLAFQQNQLKGYSENVESTVNPKKINLIPTFSFFIVSFFTFV